MEITATELKLNLGKYLETANDGPVVIKKNGKPIAQLIGTRSYEHDLSEFERWETKIKSAFIGEAAPAAYGAVASTGVDGASEAAAPGGWLLTYNGEPVAQLTPVLKRKKKRRIGFIDGPPASEETIAALFESEWTDEEYEQWLNKK
jgi:prevent-host-death family protein